QDEAELEAATNAGEPRPEGTRLRQNRTYFIIFSVWWVLGAWIAFTFAGEKMPWLLTHIALPMCVFGGWYLGRLLHRVDWPRVRQQQAFWLIGITPALVVVLAVLLGAGPDTDKSLGSVATILQSILAVGVAVGLIYLAWRWGS